MALTEEQQKAAQQQNGILNVSATKFYFDTLRPMLLEFNKTYHTDRELNRTIVEVLNKADSSAIARKWDELEESYDALFRGINDKNYMISGPLRYASDAEKQAVREISAKLNDLSVILKFEKPDAKTEHPIKERLNYREPEDGRPGYNLDDLSNRGPKPEKAKERIPNNQYAKEKYAY